MRLATLLVPLALATAVNGAFAQAPGAPADDRVARYAEASRQARAGQIERALESFDALARDFPAWVPASRGLGLVAASAGEELAETWRGRLRERVRRLRRDIAASVALAVLEKAAGHREEAHRLLLTAVTAGARSPLLVPLLLETSEDPAGLAGWFALRASVLPGDSAFEAMRARLLLAEGRTAEADRIVRASLQRHPDDPELLSLGARIARAKGDLSAACERAGLAAGLLPPVEVPEIRIPRRLWLARALIACGRTEPARGLLAGLGPMATPPGSPVPAEGAAVVRAELELATGEPVKALARLPQAPAADPFWSEAARAVRLEALAAIGAGYGEEGRTLPREPLPAGLAP
ncbi:MAG: hypothetical protein D6718_10580, partial [Acidobacteria bacterium]